MRVGCETGVDYFVTSDLHFYHRNILKYSNRPFESVEIMNTSLISNWNSVVGSKDIVFNLGDFAFCGGQRALEIFSQLNGTQIFVYGNHDHVLKKSAIKDECINKGYVKSFCDYVEFRYGKDLICMSHYSMRVWNSRHHGSLMLYGHSHGDLLGIGRSMDVGIDSNDMPSNFKPFKLDDVVNFLKNKEID